MVRAVEARAKELNLCAHCDTLDGVVAIAHTEAGGRERPHNYELLLRTLSGFVVHANVAAAVVVDYGHEVLTGADLEGHMRANQFPLDSVPHAFLRLSGEWEKDVEAGVQAVQHFLPTVAGMVGRSAARVGAPITTNTNTLCSHTARDA